MNILTSKLPDSLFFFLNKVAKKDDLVIIIKLQFSSFPKNNFKQDWGPEDIFEFMHGYIVGEILVGAMLVTRTEEQNTLTSEEIEEIGQMVLPKKSIFCLN
jgi:hypothetical protein